MPVLAVALLLVFMAAARPAAAAEKVFPTGRLIENLASDRAPGQKFTVYLPTSYDRSRPSPILFLMDPRGRARVPAKLFEAAAERYGYILISSHSTSSDGPMEPNLLAMQAMWDDSHDWFNIDARRVYLAGFSGTARTASLIADNRAEAITGIIAAGAGLHPNVIPSARTRFLYFTTVGDADYNFHEIEWLEHALASHDVPHRVERFSGPHSWMPPHLAMQAVEWLELRAMQSGTRPRDAALLERWWMRDEAAARERLTAVRPLSAARRFAAMARDYQGLRDTTEVKGLSQRLASTTEAKVELKRRQTESQRSGQWIEHAMQSISEAFPEGSKAPAIAAERLARALELAALKATAASLVTEPALEAQRRLNQLEVQLGFYLPHDAIAAGELTRAAYYLSLAVQINEASPVCWYLMAETYGRLDARRESLAALRRAIDVGFRDLRLVEADPAFAGFREDPEYRAIVDLLRMHGDTLNPLTVDRPPTLGLY